MSQFGFGFLHGSSVANTGQASNPTITGIQQVGQTLTAHFIDNDPDGAATGITYQWIRDSGTTIVGATSSTYTLQTADGGHTVKVQVSYTDGKGFAETVTSSSTGTIATVSSGSSTFNSGTSASFTVPNYNTLDCEGWGGGGGGMGRLSASNTSPTPGTNGGATTIICGSDTLTAGGGPAATGSGLNGAQSSAATASGGTTNTSGNVGGAGGTNSNPTSTTSGLGAGAPNGGGNASGVTRATSTTGLTTGNSGSAPGGGASGDCETSNSQGTTKGYSGANSGAYVKKTYTIGTAGAPVPGDVITYTVGAKGVGHNDGSGQPSADGAAGRVKFTWS